MDNNALRAIALDHLGVIAAKIRGSALKFGSGSDEGQGRGLKGLDEVRYMCFVPCPEINLKTDNQGP
ncbi:hypothetical protein MPER_14439 [Moniliophthora perniciosa FA553]|nr:hypothetical protein MPER_14439 [Moniliophthora perniciosa FA553]